MNSRIQREILLLLFPISSIIVTAILYSFMPEQIPASFTLLGNVASYTELSAVVFIVPVLSVFYYLYLLIVPMIDKERESYDRFKRAYNIMRLAGGAALAIINAIYILAIFYPNSIELFIALKVGIAVGLLFFGDRLPQVKRNHFIGVVNPWTLKSNYVWQVTQRFTGKLMFGTAIILLVLSFFNLLWVNAAYIAIVVSLLIAPHIYALNSFYVKQKK